jgi:hypothetical protein
MTGHLTGYPAHRQLESQWCWAAVATNVASYYSISSSWTQCLLVNHRLGKTICCKRGAGASWSKICNQPNRLDSALADVGHLSFVAAGPVNYLACEDETCAKSRPLGVRVGWLGGGGHFVVITGVNDDQSQELIVEDPFRGKILIRHRDISTKYSGNGVWTHSYYTA